MADVFEIDKSRVRQAFGQAAMQYDVHAVLQAQIREEMLSRLDLVSLTPETVLDAGCGTGLGSVALHKRYPQAHILSMDFALPMLKATQQHLRTSNLLDQITRLFKPKQQHLLCADIESLPLADQSQQLIWSNVAIQWCNELDQVFEHFYRVLQPEGLLMFSTFGPDTLKELRAAMPHQNTSVSRFIDMHDIGDALVRAGFQAPVLDVERYTLTYDTVHDVMKDLKNIGANNATAGRAKGLKGRGFMRTLAENYAQFQLADGKFPATFEVVYGHAWRGETQPAKANQEFAPIAFRPRNAQ